MKRDTERLAVKNKLNSFLYKAELQGLLDSLILDENERMVMDLHYCEKMQLKEIAGEIGCSVVAVQKIHMRVLDKLKPVLLKDR